MVASGRSLGLSVNSTLKKVCRVGQLSPIAIHELGQRDDLDDIPPNIDELLDNLLLVLTQF
jgi:hypothetical protein